ncbi:MAG: response regulator, partial [Nitrospirae bacterium]|nr:response regulator [Candidatus Manganitrophaceae bacterium]
MPYQQKIKNSAILYIEDDAITRVQLSQYLRSQCKVLYTAEDGEEGLECYKKFEPDIVVTDIEMPKLNGLMMINEIRKISLSTQIIIITAYKKPQYLLEAVNQQLVQYLIKPISLEKITAVLTFAENFMDGKLETKKVIGNGLCYDTYSKELTDKSRTINLSKHERALIELLIKKHPSPASY